MNESISSPASNFPEPAGPGPVTLTARKYAWRYVGNVAFWIQRLTGIALVGYLILHVHTIHDLQNPEKFDDALKLFSTPLFKLAEIGLLATVILHALNGIRLTMVDMGVNSPANASGSGTSRSASGQSCSSPAPSQCSFTVF